MNEAFKLTLHICFYIKAQIFMLVYNSEDIFNPEKTPEMVKELSALNEGTAHTPIYFKAEIIISYLKNHSLKTEWIIANPNLVDLMLNGFCKTIHIESLFEYCRFNQPFSHSYEKYIRQQVLNTGKYLHS